jgi:uncharacterized membrane protein
VASFARMNISAGGCFGVEVSYDCCTARDARCARWATDDHERSKRIVTNQAGSQQSEIMRKNVSALIEMQRKVVAARSVQDRAADAITDFAGSMTFVYVHAVWFGVWVLLNVGLLHLPYVSNFDPFPFGLLTMIVSLEAIFLSTFIMVSQNRQARISEKRAELDLQVNLLSEQKATKVLEMLDQIATQLDATSKHFNFTHDPEVDALKVSPEPQEVLRVMEETVKEQTGEIKEKVEEVSGATGALRHDVKRMSGKLDEVAEDVEIIKKEVE